MNNTGLRWSSAAKSMLPGNAKCDMTSLADTKHIFRERKINLFMAHRILHLAKTTRSSRDASALRAQRDYKLASLAAFGRSLRENKSLSRPTFK